VNIEQLYAHLGNLMADGVNPNLPVEVEASSQMAFAPSVTHYEGVCLESVKVMPGDDDPEIDRLVILPASSINKAPCGHDIYSGDRCAEMPCPNYVMKA
jgi:hypothetical protein